MYNWHKIRKNEHESLIELVKLYIAHNLPIIVVYTMAWNDEQISVIKESMENMEIQVSFKDIIAKSAKIRKNEIPSEGVEDLINLSIKKAKNAIGSSCNTALRKNCCNDIKQLVYGKSDRINEVIEREIEKDLNKIQIK